VREESAPQPSIVPVYKYRDRWPRPVWLVFRAFRAVLVASAFVGFWGGAVLLAWTVLPIVALVARDHRRHCQRIVAAAFRLFHGYMRVLGLLDAQLVSPMPEHEGPVVFIANHTTLVDVTAIFSSLPKVCSVAGFKYAASPFFGRLLSLCGFIPAGRTVEERARMLDVAQKRLDDGYNVLLFPEDSRSPEGEMRRFQRGAFELACRAKVPVVPLVMRCRPSALRKDQRFWQQPDTVAKLTIEIDPATLPADYAFSSRKMRDALEARDRGRLGLSGAKRKLGGAENAGIPRTDETL
jgi:1-acyl-sn-glycerol-3-phosphate acyltransferase